MAMDFFLPRDSTSAPASMSATGEAVMKREERMDSHSVGVQELLLARRELIWSCFTVGVLVKGLISCTFLNRSLFFLQQSSRHKL